MCYMETARSLAAAADAACYKLSVCPFIFIFRRHFLNKNLRGQKGVTTEQKKTKEKKGLWGNQRGAKKSVVLS
jgi:hypothetical protein